MMRLVLLLIPAVLLGSPLRYARLGEFDGKAEVQLSAADPWQPAARNLPLVESAWVRTDPASHLEIELDEGNVIRLGPESLLELSDYTRLSSGQRITLVSLDRGVAYFTGQAAAKDTLVLCVPGAQVAIRRGARVRLEARDNWSQVAVIEGRAQFSSPSAELDLTEGQMARVEPTSRAKFYLYREITSLDTDRWSQERDKVLASASSAAHVPGLRYGVSDLDNAGTWINTADYGTVWKPKVQEGWTPFRDGKWSWYDDLGYTWIANESWGWLPYHYGRWMQVADTGWFWVPGKSTVFKPGEVYWLRGAKAAGWGPLAPGEDWTPASVPRLFLNANTTWASFAADAREIDPAGFTARPKEPLATATFALALPSPAFVAARLDAVRPQLRVTATRLLPVITGSSYDDPQAVASSVAPEPSPDAAQPAPAPAASMYAPPSPPPVVVTVPQQEQPSEIYYPVPVYTGIVVMNPPLHEDPGAERRHRRQQQPPPPAPPKSDEKPKPAPAVTPRPAPTPAPESRPVSRSEPDHRDHGHAPAAPVSKETPPDPGKRDPDKPIPRSGSDGTQPGVGPARRGQ